MATLTLCRQCVLGQGAAPRGIFPQHCESPFSAFLHLEQGRDSGDPSALPRTGAGSAPGPPHTEVGAGHNGWARPFPRIPPTAPAVLTCPGGCTEAHSKITSASLPEGPGQPGACRKQEKLKMRLDHRRPRRRLGTQSDLLAGGREVALPPGARSRSRARKAARPPRPQPAPARAAAPGPPAHCSGARLGAGVNAGLGHSAGRWQRLLVRGGDPGDRRSTTATTRSAGLGPRTRGQRGRSWRLGTSQGFTLSGQTSRRAALAVSASAPQWGLPKLPQFILVQEEPRVLAGDSPPRPPPPGEPSDPDGLVLAPSAPPWRTVTPDLLVTGWGERGASGDDTGFRHHLSSLLSPGSPQVETTLGVQERTLRPAGRGQKKCYI